VLDSLGFVDPRKRERIECVQTMLAKWKGAKHPSAGTRISWEIGSAQETQ